MNSSTAQIPSADIVVARLLGAAIGLSAAAAALVVSAFNGVPVETAALRAVGVGIATTIVTKILVRLLVRWLLKAPALQAEVVHEGETT